MGGGYVKYAKDVMIRGMMRDMRIYLTKSRSLKITRILNKVIINSGIKMIFKICFQSSSLEWIDIRLAITRFGGLAISLGPPAYSGRSTWTSIFKHVLVEVLGPEIVLTWPPCTGPM